jgi:hypothetical protein
MSGGRDDSCHAIALDPRDMSSCPRIWMAAIVHVTCEHRDACRLRGSTGARI